MRPCPTPPTGAGVLLQPGRHLPPVGRRCGGRRTDGTPALLCIHPRRHRGDQLPAGRRERPGEPVRGAPPSLRRRRAHARDQHRVRRFGEAQPRGVGRLGPPGRGALPRGRRQRLRRLGPPEPRRRAHVHRAVDHAGRQPRIRDRGPDRLDRDRGGFHRRPGHGRQPTGDGAARSAWTGPTTCGVRRTCPTRRSAP